MTRPRSTVYVVGAVLILFFVYTFSTISTDIFSYAKTNPIPKPKSSLHPEQYDAVSDNIFEAANDGYESETFSDFTTTPTSPTTAGSTSHPIDDLMQSADQHLEGLLSKRTYTLKDAAAVYREQRGRHPPPGFDLWFNYAMEHDAVIVEEFFDQIYHDLNPFWAISPALLRAQARDLGMAVTVKDGNATATTDWFWHQIWGRMINEVAPYLPDMMVPLNPMDESRLLVRWENMTEYMSIASKEKKIVDKTEVVKQIQGWGLEPDNETEIPMLPDPRWNGFDPYAYARRACPADSPARQVAGTLSSEAVMAMNAKTSTSSAVKGYFDGNFVTNYTQATDFCTDATVAGLHGALIQPLTCSNTDVLLPMFGGSKFHVNNEILLPAPMYWNSEDRFGGNGHGDRTPWTKKESAVVWRGTATGGRNKPVTWHLFHRHRYVAMTNSTKYSLADSHHDLIFNDFLRQSAITPLTPQIRSHMSTFLDSVHNVAFTNLVCDEPEPDGGCWYTNEEFWMDKPIEFQDQYQFKYLPDIDGNSFSGRYRAFLLSDSLPIKATIYREWHDSRLVPWRHFVPMNNRFSDYYRILEYFIGSKEAGMTGHDKEAQKIATEGRKWAEKVLRKVDMQIYVLRLLLEYGRVTDDHRLQVGFVDDLEIQ